MKITVLFVSAVALATTLAGPPFADAQIVPPVATSADHVPPPGSIPRDAGAPLSLRDAIDDALETNPTLVAARLEYDATRQRRAQEGFLAPPMLEAEIWQWPLSSVNPLNTNMYMFTMQQELPGAGKRALRAAVVDKDVDRGATEMARRARDVIDQVRQAYANLYVGRQAIAVHQAGVELLRQTADLATARYGSGHGSQQDVLKTVAEISRLHGDLLVLEERTALAAVQLNTLLNRSPDTPIGALTGEASDIALPPVEELQRLALAGHPEVQAARIEVERADAIVAVAKSDYEPDFVVGGGYQLMPRSAGAWMATVGITWPNAPWARGRLDAARAQAVADVAAAQARQHVVTNAVTSAVQQAYIRVTSARARASLLRDTVIPQSEQVVEAARIAYQSDRGEATSLLDSQRTVLDVQLEYFRALGDLQQAHADLERAVGTDLEGW